MINFDKRISDIETPALVVDEVVMKENLNDIMNFAKNHDVNLRPHIKTHKCPELAKIQVNLGAPGIAVAKISEAEVMFKNEIKNIQIANEIVDSKKLMKLVQMLKEKANITIAVDNNENVETISDIMIKNNVSINVLVDINTGLNRCGLYFEDHDKIIEFVKNVNSKPGINFQGIMTHAGHVYGKAKEEVEQTGISEGKVMVDLKKVIEAKTNIKCKDVSVGSTPTAKHAGKQNVTEIRPGNYIFYDNIQVSLGVVYHDNCALRVLAQVISIPSDDRVIIDAGSKSLGLDTGAHGTTAIEGYGFIMDKNTVVSKLSEEHGFIKENGVSEKFYLGEKVQIIPNHACSVVNLFDKIYSLNRDKEFLIEARGCSQ